MKRIFAPPHHLFFIGDARKNLKAFPAEVQDEIGLALQKVQWGSVPHHSKPLKGFGGVSVMEIYERHQTNTYRAIYTAQFAEAVYVLHCFKRNRKAALLLLSRISI